MRCIIGGDSRDRFRRLRQTLFWLGFEHARSRSYSRINPCAFSSCDPPPIWQLASFVHFVNTAVDSRTRKPAQLAVGFVSQKSRVALSRLQNRHSLPLGSFGRNCASHSQGCKIGTVCRWVRFAGIVRFSRLQNRCSLPLGTFGRNCVTRFQSAPSCSCLLGSFAEIANEIFGAAQLVQLGVGFVSHNFVSICP